MILVMQNAFSTLKVMNSSLLIVFPFTELEKFCVFFLNPDLIPELKPNLLLCNMVTIMITMRIVGKAYGNAWWPKDVRNHHYWSYFFSIWISFHEHSRFIGQQGNGEAISVTPLYHFHSLHRHLGHLEIILAITTEILPLHIAIS